MGFEQSFARRDDFSERRESKVTPIQRLQRG